MATKPKAHVDLGVEPHVLGLIVGYKNVIAQSEVLFLKEKIFECSVALVGSTSCRGTESVLQAGWDSDCAASQTG